MALFISALLPAAIACATMVCVAGNEMQGKLRKPVMSREVVMVLRLIVQTLVW
jgi:hypothetical protein